MDVLFYLRVLERDLVFLLFEFTLDLLLLEFLLSLAESLLRLSRLLGLRLRLVWFFEFLVEDSYPLVLGCFLLLGFDLFFDEAPVWPP